MKRIIIAVAVLLFSAATFAQSTQTPDQRAKKETDKINSLVPLGSAYQKVLAVNTQDAAKREGITNGAKRSDLSDDQKAQLKALGESHKANLKAAMGADLYAKYEAARKQNSSGKPHDGD